MSVQWIIGIVASYLIGSIPFGLLIARTRGVDIRKHGSGNIGATNVMRVLGRPLGLACFVLDFLKGAVPVVGFGMWLGVLGEAHQGDAQSWLWLALAAATIGGHMYPLYLKFKGGKGVATGFGAMVGMWPVVTVPALIALLVWIGALRTWRYVSAASCLAGVAVPVSMAGLVLIGWPRDPEGSARFVDLLPYLIATTGLALLVIWKHRSNIERLRKGTEPKVGRLPESGNRGSG